VDSDAFFQRLNMSLDDLRLRWGMHDGVSILWPADSTQPEKSEHGLTRICFGVRRRVLYGADVPSS